MTFILGMVGVSTLLRLNYLALGVTDISNLIEFCVKNSDTTQFLDMIAVVAAIGVLILSFRKRSPA